SLDSTMRSNVAVGPPIDMMVYRNDELAIRTYRRFQPEDEALFGIRSQWEQGLRSVISTLPDIDFGSPGSDIENGSTCLLKNPD
ncbi:MAG: hypothetical protein RLZZ622_1201, partial [Planctomycetota bacterium]